MTTRDLAEVWAGQPRLCPRGYRGFCEPGGRLRFALHAPAPVATRESDMPRAGVEAGRAGFNERDDQDAWEGHAARDGPATQYGMGELQESPGKSRRQCFGFLFFATGWGLMLWLRGFVGVEPEGDAHTYALAGCITAYSLSGCILIWQIRRGEIFVRTNLTGEQEGVICGIKWSAFLGYVFLLVSIVVMVTLPFWIGRTINDCMHADPDGLYDGHKDRETCLKDAADGIGFAFSGVFAFFAIAFGLREIVKHWQNYYMPMQQRQVARVLWMVPIYALDAFWTVYLCFGRRYDEDGQYHVKGELEGCDDSWSRLVLETVREGYEAYTIYAFFTYLVESLHQKALDEQVEGRDRTPEGHRRAMDSAKTGAGGGGVAAAEGGGGGGGGGSIQQPLLGSANSAKRRSTPEFEANGRLQGGIVRSHFGENPDLLFDLLKRNNPDGVKHDYKWGMCWLTGAYVGHTTSTSTSSTAHR